MGVRRSKKKKKKKGDGPQLIPPRPFLKNIKTDLCCQLVSLPRLRNPLSHEPLCAALTHPLHTLTYMHTQAAPTSGPGTTCSLPLLPGLTPPVHRALLDSQSATREAPLQPDFWKGMGKQL